MRSVSEMALSPSLIQILIPIGPFVVFEEEEDPSQKSFFSEIISSISDVKFSKDGNYILSRDYLTLKIWDVRNEKAPVKKINIHDHLRGKLCDLYENDCIFDKFECTFSGDGKCVTICRVMMIPGTDILDISDKYLPARTTTTSGYTTLTMSGPTALCCRRTSLRSRRRRLVVRKVVRRVKELGRIRKMECKRRTSTLRRRFSMAAGIRRKIPSPSLPRTIFSSIQLSDR